MTCKMQDWPEGEGGLSVIMGCGGRVGGAAGAGKAQESWLCRGKWAWSLYSCISQSLASWCSRKDMALGEATPFGPRQPVGRTKSILHS